MDKKLWRQFVSPGKDWVHLARVAIVPGRTTKLHTHDFAELFFVETGVGWHGINGDKRKLKAGDLILMRPEDGHELIPSDTEGFVIVNLAFPAEVLKELVARHAEVRKLYPPNAKYPERVELSTGELQQMQAEVAGLSRMGTSRLVLERCLTNIFVLLTRESRIESPHLPAWLERACTGIQRPERFAEGTAAFVKLAGRNAEYVARTTKRLLGMTPTEYINRLRMEHAARELRLGSKPIIEIALECGINNLSHFYTLFRSALGSTPRRYRLMSQGPAR